jgi:hypothetical protein
MSKPKSLYIDPSRVKNAACLARNMLRLDRACRGLDKVCLAQGRDYRVRVRALRGHLALDYDHVPVSAGEGEVNAIANAPRNS